MWRLPTNFPLSYNLLPCLCLTRSRRAWMEEWFCPSHCLICLGKALTSNTNLNDSSGNLGSVSEARLGLAQWPSLREHGKFAGSICHSQHELRKRTRKEWLNGLDPWLALVDVRRSAALVVLWDYQKLYHRGCIQLYRAGNRRNKNKSIHNSKYMSLLMLEVIEHCFPYSALEFSSICMSATSLAHQQRSIKTAQHYNKWQSYHSVRRQTLEILFQASRWIRPDPIHWKSALHWHKQRINVKLDISKGIIIASEVSLKQISLTGSWNKVLKRG